MTSTATALIPTETEVELRRLISSGAIELTELMNRLVELQPEPEAPAPAERPKPKSVVLSDEQKKALRTLAAKLADAQLPTEPVILTPEQREAFVPLFDQIKLVKAASTTAEDAFKGVFHNHLDLQAPEDAPVDSKGHKITEGEVVADNWPNKVTRGIVGGKAVELTDYDLQRLLDEGQITQAQYRRMTKPVTGRQPVPAAIMAELAKDPSLLDKIASVAKPTAKGTAIRMAKNK